MNKSKIFGAMGLSLFIALAAVGGTLTHAWFSDRDVKIPHAEMAAVDIELAKQEFSKGQVSFTVNNNSNTDIYMRVGVIFETKADGEWAIADTSGININVTTAESGWLASKKTVVEGGVYYDKWFLTYATDTYTPIPASKKELAAAFYVTGAPDGHELVVSVVPEAVQADTGGEALKYLKEQVNPAW